MSLSSRVKAVPGSVKVLGPRAAREEGHVPRLKVLLPMSEPGPWLTSKLLRLGVSKILLKKKAN